MAEYTGVYRVGRQMHARPLTEVVKLVCSFPKPYGDLDIRVRNSGDDPKDVLAANARSVMSLMTDRIGKRQGSSVDIIITGEYPIETLKKCADMVGKMFESGEDYF